MSKQSPMRGLAVRINESPCASCPFVAKERRRMEFLSAEDAAALREACKTSPRDRPNVCHASVYGMHGIEGGASVCRGFMEANPTHGFDQRYKLPRPPHIDVLVPAPARSREP